MDDLNTATRLPPEPAENTDSITALAVIEKAANLDAEDRLLLPELGVLTDVELANAINNGCRNIEAIVLRARDHNRAALVGALWTGAYLAEVHRRCENSDLKWRDWIKQHCPEIAESTAYRYMRLAHKFSHERIDHVTTLRQAYIEVGIVKEAPPKKKPSADLSKVPAVTGTDFLEQVKSLREFYATALRKLDPAMLEDPVRRSLGKEITSLVAELTKFKDRLAAEISKPATGKVAKPASRAGRSGSKPARARAASKRAGRSK